MSSVTIKVEIDHGRIIPDSAEKLPEHATGFLTILTEYSGREKRRVTLPLVKSSGKQLINPGREELDDSLWGE
jgi:hypothetical protein